MVRALAPACWGRGYGTEIGRVLEKRDYVRERDLVHQGLPHVPYRRVREKGRE